MVTESGLPVYVCVVFVIEIPAAILDGITGAGGVTVITSVALPVPPALRALIVTLVVPAAVGVPDITAPLRVKPAGNVPVV